MKSVLRWAGSKQSMLTTFEEKLPLNYNNYIEPFCGSASLFFHLEPANSILSDLNEELINGLIQLRDNSIELIERLFNIDPTKSEYYKLRGIDPESLDSLDRAARFFFLNYHCFNGLYRTNRSGIFNVPFGANEGRFPNELEIRKASKLLANTNIQSLDFEKLTPLIETNDFVYLDPPYALTYKRIFSEYNKETFSVKDIPRLRLFLEHIDSIGAHFLLTYEFSDEAITLSNNFKSIPIHVRRNIAGFADSRKVAKELLIWN